MSNQTALNELRWSFDAYVVNNGLINSRKCAYSWTTVEVKNASLCDQNPFYKEQTVKLATWPLPPWHYVGPRMGVDEIVLDLLSKKLEFKYEVTIVIAYNDVIRLIVNKTTDIAISQPSMTHQRQQIISFSGAMNTRNLYFKSLLPKPLTSYFTLFRPFHEFTWIGCILSIICTGLTLMSVEVLFGTKRVYENISISVSCMLKKSLPLKYFEKKATKGEITLYWLLLPSGCILNMAYTSILLANLITFQYEKPINTAQDVLDSGRPITGPKQAWIIQALVHHPKPIFKKLRALGRLQPFDMRNEEQRLRHGRYLHEGKFVGSDYPLNIIGIEDKFRLGTEMIAQSFTGWAFAKSSPLIKPASLYIQRLVDGGFIQKWMYKTKSEDVIQKLAIQEKIHFDQPLSIAHCLPMIFLLPFGLIPALIAFIAELLHGRVAAKRY